MKKGAPSLFIALIPLLFLIALLALNVFTFGDDTLSFSSQLTLLAAAGVAGLTGLRFGVPFSELMEGALDNIRQAVPAILVLLLIGSLAGSWLLSGIVPAMIYYGLQVLSPGYFLVTCCVICSLISLATGSSWGTVATVGIAMMGIDKAMGFHEGLVAGSIISGAYFGDKMSPLSDTTNLAPAVSGSNLFDHIRYMTITTVPSMGITLVLFFFIGLFLKSDAALSSVDEVTFALQSQFNLTPLLFLVPATVILLIVKRIPATPSLAIGSLLGIAFALLFQGDLIDRLLTSGSYQNAYALSLTALGTDFSIPSDQPLLADLLSTGGMSGMLNTIWLIVCAMVFGGVMERSGCLAVLTNKLLMMARGRTGLIGTTAFSSVLMNLTASDQYLAIVVPGKMFEKAYRDQGLAPVNLSRTLEDAGTVTSVLVPWNTCGATQAGVLGVATAVYWPFCFFCLLSPLVTVSVAALNFRIKRL